MIWKIRAAIDEAARKEQDRWIAIQEDKHMKPHEARFFGWMILISAILAACYIAAEYLWGFRIP